MKKWKMNKWYSVEAKWIEPDKLKKFQVSGNKVQPFNGIIEAYNLEHANELLKNPETLNHLIVVGYLHETKPQTIIDSLKQVPDETEINFY